MKPKTDKYYAVICQICGYKTAGNWLDVQLDQYQKHWISAHYLEPFIKTQDEPKPN